MFGRLRFFVKKYVCLCAFVVFLSGLKPADGAVFRVDKNNSSGGDGSSWGSSLNESQFGESLRAAQSGDVFFVAKGVYRPSVPSEVASADKALSFTIPEGVSLYGGFTGIEDNLNERNWRENVTVLTGDLYLDDISDDRGVISSADGIVGINSTTVVSTKGIQTAILDGFFVTGGSGRNGGGMANVDSRIRVSKCVFWGNRAAGMGGAMLNQKGAPEIIDSLFAWNRAGANMHGGAMANVQSDPVIISCTFEDNRTGTGSSVPKDCLGNGGAVYNGRGNPVLTGCVFRRNEAGAGGGALYNQRCTPLIERCVFEDNHTHHNAGALRNESVGSDGKISQSLFRGNFTVIEGGAIYNTGTDLSIVDTTFIGNLVSADIDDDDKGSGGALYNAKSSPVVTNCTFVENRAKNGGAIYNRVNSDPLFINCTVKGNFASKKGGGMYSTSCSSSVSCAIGQGSNPVVLNSVFWDNRGGEIFNDGDSSPALYFSVVQAGDVEGGLNVVSSDISVSDPKLKEAGDNGGFSATCAISGGSSAMDKGWRVGEILSADFISGDVIWSGKSWEGLPVTVPSADQRGVSRPQGDGVDMGAFELVPEVPVVPGPVTPEPVTPEPVTPDPVTPDPVVPGPVVADPISPDFSGADPLAPILTARIKVPSGDKIKDVRWQIARDKDFNDIVFDSALQGKEVLPDAEAQSETLSLKVPAGKLTYGTNYYVRVRPLLENSGWAEWSETSQMTTEPAPSSGGGCSVAGMGIGSALLLLPLTLFIRGISKNLL
ncbi:MAG: hypothetical protein EOM02_08510 [Synergistales bacterium]|nr:hypothetical protein [Synergistales bacterium]